MDSQGLLLCAKYAIAPNFFGYCGPDENKNLVDHLNYQQADQELRYLLKDFETLFPYLQLIARDNHIENPFDYRVVEAYWIGNSLLKNIKRYSWQSFFDEKLRLEKKLAPKVYQAIKSKINRLSFLPHHAFHVLNVFKTTGRELNIQIIRAMDQCRIGWGKVHSYKLAVRRIRLETQQLAVSNQQLTINTPIIKEIRLDYHGKQFIRDLRVGDWVSFHWGMVCDRLTTGQIKNLEYYTQKAIDFYNATF